MEPWKSTRIKSCLLVERTDRILRKGVEILETFTTVKAFVHNPNYDEQRHKALRSLNIDTIDQQIVELIRGFAELAYCFTLQSCYGHFVPEIQKDSKYTELLPIPGAVASVEYRIAYMALCIENSAPGRELFKDMSALPSIDPEYVQFGCAEWFWQKQLNSFVVQVEPYRYKTKDRIVVDYQEALHIEGVRNEFFGELGRLLEKRMRA